MRGFFAAALLSSLFAATPVASADPDVSSFLAAVKSDGIVGTPSSVLTNGQYVCGYLSSGHNGLQAAKVLYANEDIDMAHAESFVVDAVHYLCPQYEPHSSSSANRAPKAIKRVPLPVFNDNVIVHDILV